MHTLIHLTFDFISSVINVTSWLHILPIYIVKEMHNILFVKFTIDLCHIEPVIKFDTLFLIQSSKFYIIIGYFKQLSFLLREVFLLQIFLFFLFGFHESMNTTLMKRILLNQENYWCYFSLKGYLLFFIFNICCMHIHIFYYFEIKDQSVCPLKCLFLLVFPKICIFYVSIK